MCVNLPLADVPFRDVMSERLGIPAFIDNDGNVATLAETRFGAARGARDVVGLTIGTGIGGGLVLGGKLYRGSRGARRGAGPRGHRPQRPALPGQLPEQRLPGGLRLGQCDRPRGTGGRAEPDSELGRAPRRGR